MLPILIVPDDWRFYAEEVAAELDQHLHHRRTKGPGPEPCVGVRWKDRRGYRPSIEIVVALARPEGAKDSADRHVSLEDGERLVNLAVRRRRETLGREERGRCKHLAVGWKQKCAAIRCIGRDTIAWLLWTMNWLGVSTPRQVFELRTHPPTLLVRLLTSLPDRAKSMRAGATLRLMWSVLERTFLYWCVLASRMKARGRFILDPHLMPVRFRVLEKFCAKSTTIGKFSSHEVKKINKLAERNLKTWYPGTRD